MKIEEFTTQISHLNKKLLEVRGELTQIQLYKTQEGDQAYTRVLELDMKVIDESIGGTHIMRIKSFGTFLEDAVDKYAEVLKNQETMYLDEISDIAKEGIN